MTTMSDNKLHKNNQKISFQYMFLTNTEKLANLYLCVFLGISFQTQQSVTVI